MEQQKRLSDAINAHISRHLRGAQRAPRFKDLLMVRLVYTSPLWCWSCVRWWYRHRICKLPYDAAEQTYLTRRALGLSADQWEDKDDGERAACMAMCLWEDEPLAAYKAQRELENKERQAKRLRRGMKKLR